MQMALPAQHQSVARPRPGPGWATTLVLALALAVLLTLLPEGPLGSSGGGTAGGGRDLSSAGETGFPVRPLVPRSAEAKRREPARAGCCGSGSGGPSRASLMSDSRTVSSVSTARHAAERGGADPVVGEGEGFPELDDGGGSAEAANEAPTAAVAGDRADATANPLTEDTL